MSRRAWVLGLIFAGLIWVVVLAAFASRASGGEPWHDSAIPQAAFVSVGAPSPVRASAGPTRPGVGDVMPDRVPLRHGVAGGVDRAVLEQPSLPGASSPAITGVASWYAYIPGGAAAGPALRSALGSGWRGKSVAVCATSLDGTATACVHVTLTDFMAADRLIDLDRESAFAFLADPSRGLVTVTVYP